jgi:small subunit ribosomal protein S17
MENQQIGRKQLVGKVVSNGGDKTISVLVEAYKKHPLYSKRVKQSKKHAAHDEQSIAEVGDLVRIEETRPLSKTKHFRLVEIIEKAIKI